MVCDDCAVLGSLSWEVKERKATTKLVKKQKVHSRRESRVRKPKSPLEPNLELVEDYGSRIRRARESRGLSLEELGNSTNEKVSVLKKLEGGKMIPSHKLAQKLQHALRISLLAPVSEERPSKKLLDTNSPKTITLGDLIKDRKGSSEETR